MRKKKVENNQKAKVTQKGYDFSQLATKKDLLSLATKKDLLDMSATNKELFATKKDLLDMSATNKELFATKKDIRGETEKLDKKIELVNSSLLATKKDLKNEINQAVVVMNEKIEFVGGTLGGKIELLSDKMDLMLTNMDNFSHRLEDEEQERIIGQKQLERRVEKLEKVIDR